MQFCSAKVGRRLEKTIITKDSFLVVTASGAVFDSGTAELWKFRSPELNFNPAASQFRFAAFYRNLPSGDVFWDNNLGQDYKGAKPTVPPLNNKKSVHRSGREAILYN